MEARQPHRRQHLDAAARAPDRTNRFIVKTAPTGPIVPSSPPDYAEFFALMSGDTAATVAITMTPIAGGTDPVSANLVIRRAA